MDLFEAVEKRRSIRKYKADPIPEEDLKKILEAARLAPSGGNRQPWFFVVVRRRERKKALATAANLQHFMADADTIVVALGDPGASRNLHKQDPMIAVEHMVLAATALGYGTCWIAAFSEDEIKKIVKVPENLVVVALLPIGVPNESPPPRSRKAFTEIFFKGTYGRPLKM